MLLILILIMFPDEVGFRPASVLKMEEKHNELMKQMERKFKETTERGAHNVYSVCVCVCACLYT